MQLIEHQRARTLNVRFSPAQFHQSLPSVLKGILNRRVVKESHRDAPYKGIPPTPSILFSPSPPPIAFSPASVVHRFDHHRELPPVYSVLLVIPMDLLVRYVSRQEIPDDFLFIPRIFMPYLSVGKKITGYFDRDTFSRLK